MFPNSFPPDPFDAQRKLIQDFGIREVTILDIGANHGQTTEIYRRIFPDASVYCFEPFPQAVEILRNKYSGDEKIHIVPKAVANTSGRRTFYVNDFDVTNSLLPRPSFSRRYFPEKSDQKDTIEVDVIALDEFMIANEISRVDIAKFDIQGGEIMALQGAKELLATGNLSLIYTEIMFVPHYEGNPLLYELWSYLAEFGYTIFDIYSIRRATNGQIRYADALFVSEAMRKEVIDRYTDEP